jgi:hypothetical protein
MFSTFAQVLPCFQGEFQLSFPLVTALRALPEGSDDVRFALLCRHSSPASLGVLRTAKRRVLVVSRTTAGLGATTVPRQTPARHRSFRTQQWLDSSVRRLFRSCERSNTARQGVTRPYREDCLRAVNREGSSLPLDTPFGACESPLSASQRLAEHRLKPDTPRG